MSHRSRFVVAVVFASLLGVLLLLFGLAALIGGLTADRGSGGVDWGVVSTAIVLLGCGIGCGSWAVHLEHRLRGHPAGKIAFDPARTSSSTAIASAGTARKTPRRRRNGPVARAIFMLIWTAISVFLVVSALGLHAQADRSAYVQASGLQRSATVVSMRDIQHQSKYSTWYTAEVSARLSTPVGGQTATKVEIPYSVSYLPGEPLSVLVDPQQPGYAELPGVPDSKSSQWVSAALLAVVLCGFDIWVILVAIRDFRRRHAWQAMLPAHHPAVS